MGMPRCCAATCTTWMLPCLHCVFFQCSLVLVQHAGAATGSTATDSKKMFEAELDSIRHLLTEVRTAVQVSATCGLQPSDHEQVRTRGEEVKAVGEWCHQEGGEVCLLDTFLYLSLALCLIVVML